MKRCMTLLLVLFIAGWLSVDEGFGRGGGRGGGGGGRGGGGGMRGGGGGGGMRGGGGGGGFRGGAPGGGFSGGGRPAARPGGGGGGGRIAGGGGGGRVGGGGGVNRGPSFSAPGGGRPGGGAIAGGRPSIQPGTRPSIGGGAGAGIGVGQRPAIGAGGARPGIGAGQLPAGGARPGAGAGIGQRPAIGAGGARPGIGQLPTGGARPGTGAGIGAGIGAAGIGAGIAAGARPGTLPGLGGGTGLGSGNRGQNLGSRQDRAANLSDRMANAGDRMNMGDRQGQRQENRGDRQGQRQDARGDRQQDRQDYRNNAREDWQNWAGDHGGWYHGAWSGGWYPGAGWGYMWDNYPVAAALGVTSWGINRLSYAFGMGGYSNPYCEDGGGGYGYDYSQPVAQYVAADYAQPVATDPAATTTTTAPALPPGVTQEGMSLFDQSRAAFAQGDYKQALDLCNQTLKTMPNDAVVHEFRSLVLFALKNYPESAAAAYAVLSAGPGWDWTTLSSLYANPADYTPQLRALEAYVKQNPKSSEGHFLLAYHYLTAGHADAAKAQLREVDKLTPNDRLVRSLLGMTSAADQEPATPTPKPPLEGDQLIKAEQLVGIWSAPGSGGAKFQMTLDKDSAFSWKFTSGKKSDEVTGVFAVEQNNLALQVNDGTVMLAEIALKGNRLQFKVIGGEKNDPGLTFTKAN